jgi:hypothetical protein
MSFKKLIRKSQPTRKVRTKRVAKRIPQKNWHPSNYLLESNTKLGLPGCEEDTRAYASPV